MPKFVLDRRQRKMPVNPSLEFADSMVEEARNCDAVVSIGGGSTIDVGKYVSCSLGVKHTAIPTTAGSGSEVTRYAVLTNGNGQKETITKDEMLPDEYLFDPDLLTSLPDLQTLSSGMDALSQAMESFWSANGTRESRELARLAVGLVTRNLHPSREKPKDTMLRMNMLTAANLSGRAINVTGTNICHAISYPLTQHYDIPHGIACGLTLAGWMRFFDWQDKVADSIDRTMKALLAAYPAYRPLDHVALIAEEAMSYEKIQTGPKRVTLHDVKRILEKSLCG